MNSKHVYIILALLVSFITSAQITVIDCDNSKLTYDKAHVKLLHTLMDSAKISKGGVKITLEQQFFCVMPNSFDKMLDLLFLDSTIIHNKVKESGGPPPKFHLDHPWVSFLSEINCIESNQYYNKYIDMCIDGFYGADDIRNGFVIYKRFETDTEAFCKALAKRNDSEIKSVFWFIFDSSHPENEFNQELYDKIYPLIYKENKKLALLMKSTLERLIKEKRH
ncbi:hypothetical protein [Psychroserpens luteolus]|uniref:hypothetical protein n=1 Tax=Psychroserpens luteolus TaxID=2855840 RepID=UPI001E3CA594|nr:hypothetical protein [Psychroserpens luteolus]MCD2260873.1 hypothetical protein [Psychroserpens luteolus]